MIRIILLASILTQCAPVLVFAHQKYDGVETKWRAQCAVCHGRKGKARPGYPSVNKLSQEHILEALTDYKNNLYRGDMSEIMFGMAASLTDEEVELMSEYIPEVFGDGSGD